MSGSHMMAGHAAARVLREAGVPWVAGVPGESFLPLLDGLREEGVPFIPVRHESGATFMAATYARTARRPAVVAVTRGPGAANAFIGVHEAFQGEAPIVVLVGQLESNIRGRGALQEMEFTDVFRSAAKAVFEVTRPDQVARSLAAALRKCQLGRPGPVVVSVPADHYYGVVEPETLPPPLPQAGYSLGMAEPHVVQRIRDLALGARRGILLVGSPFSSHRQADLLDRVAGRLGFAVLGAHCFPDILPAGHRLHLGPSTIRGSRALRQTLEEADLVIVLGAWLGDRTTQGYRRFGGRVIVVKGDPEVGWDEYLDAELHVADPVLFLQQLQGALHDLREDVPGRRERLAWIDGRRAAMAEERAAVMGAASASAGQAVPMPAVVEALDSSLPPGATIVSDAGSFNDWIVRYLPFGVNRHYCGPLSGSMGFAVPGAIGVQLARPHGRAVALTGDGGFQMSLMELATAVDQKLPITVIVFNNALWGSIALHQDISFPGRRFGVSLYNPSFMDIARAYGMEGLRADDPAQLPSLLKAAFSTAGPSLVEIPTDPVHPSPQSFERRVV